ncbi:hypothetical protein [Methylobacterium sp. JK268]
MTWALIHQGAIVARGTYQQMLDLAEEWQVLARSWHLDGTEFAPRWLDRDYRMAPLAAAAARGRAA